MTERPKKYYYYAGERGCLKHPESVDELGVGTDNGKKSCSLTIRLTRLGGDGFGRPHFTMQVSAHNDEWGVFVNCRDVLDLLSRRVIPPGEMRDIEPFYALRVSLEQLGYKDLGVLAQ